MYLDNPLIETNTPKTYYSQIKNIYASDNSTTSMVKHPLLPSSDRWHREFAEWDMDTNDSRKRPLDGESDPGTTKRSNQGSGEYRLVVCLEQ